MSCVFSLSGWTSADLSGEPEPSNIISQRPRQDINRVYLFPQKR